MIFQFLLLVLPLLLLVRFLPFGAGVWLLLLSCALVFGRFQLARKNADSPSNLKALPLRWWLVAHALVVVGFCLFHTGAFIGWEEGGSPQVPRAQQRRIQYNGYYFNAPKVAFVAAPSGNSSSQTQAGAAVFEVSEFGANERVELRPPTQGQGGWRVSAFPLRQPLRLNGWIINPNSRWLQPDAQGTSERCGFSVGSIRVSYLSSAPGNNTGEDLFRFEQRGGCTAGAAKCSFEARLRPLRDGQSVRDFVQRLVSQLERDASSNDATIAERAKKQRSRFSRFATDQESGLMAGSFLVRAFRGKDANTSPDPFKKAPFKRSSHTLILVSGASQPASLSAVPAGSSARLQLGLEDGTWGVTLPGAPHVFAFSQTPGARLWPVRFLNPPHWALPSPDDYLPSASAKGEFILTSSRDYIPLPGYYFSGNGRQHEFYARAKLTPDLSHWGFTDGKTKRWQIADSQVGKGKNQSAMPRIGDQVPLGDEVQGALVSLEPARASVPFAGRQLRWRILLAFGLYLLALAPMLAQSRSSIVSSSPRDAGVLDGAWHLLWSGALVLSVFRVVLAYRVSLLPPIDSPVSQSQLQSVFEDSLRQSLWVAFWVPAAIALARFVAFWLESEGAREAKWWKNLVAPGAFCALMLALLAFDTRGVWPAPALFAVLSVAVVTAWMLRRTQIVTRRAKSNSRVATSSSSATTAATLTKNGRLLVIGALFGVWIVWAVACLVLAKIRVLPSINLFSLPLMALVLMACLFVLARIKEGALLWPVAGVGSGGAREVVAHQTIPGSPKEREARKKAAAGFFTLCVWACIAGMIAGTLMLAAFLDPGITLYLFAVGVAASQLWLLRDNSNRWIPILAPGSAMLLVAGVLALQSTPLATAVRLSLQDQPVGYRLAVLGDREQDVFLADTSAASAGESGRRLDPLTLIKNNSQQQWQMLHYVSQGRHNTPGYGQAPLNEQAMTYATAVSDCVFAVFIVGEHGMATALGVLGLYLLIGGACFWAMSALNGQRRARWAPLSLVGGFFMGMALYMAAANIGLLVFTGQNLPLLSLRSSSDALQCLLLLAFASFLINANAESDGVQARLESSPSWGGAAFWLVGVACFAVIGLRLWNFAAPQPYNLSQGVIEHLRQNQPVPAGSEGAGSGQIMWTKTPDQFVLRAQKGVSLLEQQNVSAFNSLSQSEQLSTGGLYHVRGGEVTSNLNAFRLTSPFSPVKNWTGAVLARGHQEPEPVLTALGRPFSISLSSGVDALPIILDFDARNDAAQRGLGRIILRERGGSTLAQVTRDPRNGQVRISRGALEGYRLWVEGKSLNDAKTPADRSRVLSKFDLITIERRANPKRGGDGGAKRFNLIFLDKQSPALAFCQWRNGRPQMFYQKSDVFPLGASIMDTARQIASPKLKQINLSLDLPLHEQLQRDMDAWARSQSDFRRSRQDETKSRQQRLALTVMDAFSGEVLALPSWPRVDPNKGDFADIADPDQRRALLDNHNFVDHAVGSTIKPLTYSTVAAAFWPRYDVSELSVLATGSEGTFNVYRRFGGLQLDKPFSPPGNPPTVMTLSGEPDKVKNNFLVRSLNWPEVVLGGLGTLQSPSQWPLALRPARGARPDVMWQDEGESKPMRFDLSNIPNSSFSLPNGGQNPVVAPDQLETSLLFRGYNTFADARFSNDRASIQAFRLKEARQQWPSLAPHVAPDSKNQSAISRRLDALGSITTEDVDLDPRRLSGIKSHFISFLLGGGECRWNNVSMTEVAARLATGQRVEATFESRSPKNRPQWNTLPSPIGDTPSNAKWRTQNLLRVLNGVSTLKQGTAHSYTSGKLGRYVGLFKSGTINEDDDPRGRNSETLLFVIGELKGSLETEAEFVPGRTVAGYLYMQKCNVNNANDLRKAQLFPRLMKDVVRYLDQR